MRTVVFAYHNMGIVGLDALSRHGYDIPGVFTHRDDPNEEVWFQSVEKWCLARSIEVFSPDNVNTPEEIEHVKSLEPDVIFSFYYRKMLSPGILSIPACGCLNLHGSLLPMYRGRAPVNWVLVNGEKETGVTLHYMLEKPDAGDIVGQRGVRIDFEDTALTLFRKMEVAARDLLDDVLPKIKTDSHERIPNRIDKGSYFSGRRPEDGRIEWTGDCVSIYNLVRAVTHPYPGAFGELDGEMFYVWRARPVEDITDLEPGSIDVREGAAYAGCGRGALELLEVEHKGRVLKDKEISGALAERRGEKFK